MTETTRSYSIKVTDIASGEDVVLTVANWTDEEKHVAITQIARLAGAPTGAADLFAEKVAPKPKPRRRKH
jgi:hypothetical protein